MPNEFTLPELGENVTAGDGVRVLVAAGDTLAQDQPILELETDKATIEVPSTIAGTVQEVKVKQGDKVKVGQVVLTVGDEGGAAKAAPPAKARKDAADKPKAQPAGAPEEGGLSQAAPGRSGDSAAQGDAASARKGAEERDKGTTASAPEERLEEPGEEPGAEPEASPAEAPKARRGEVVDIHRGAKPQAPPDAPPEGGVAAPAAPSVRRLARELGVEIAHVTGSGPDGRISAEDVQDYVKSVMSGRAAGGGIPAPQLPDFSRWGEIQRKPMSNIRRKTAEHLSSAWTTIPHVTNHDKADITALEGLRKQYGGQAEKAGGKMTMTAVAVKIVAAAMTRFPQFNASVDMARQEIVYKKAVHVGIAVDTERGLLVPVIRDADRKGVIDISVERTRLSERARAGKLSLDEMQGGGMSISNLGGIGGTAFTPIVNWPEVAILGISRGGFEPFWNGTAFEPRQMLPLSLSYDHRVVDGAAAARFTSFLAGLLADLRRAML